jgi:hypothetical protein
MMHPEPAFPLPFRFAACFAAASFALNFDPDSCSQFCLCTSSALIALINGNGRRNNERVQVFTTLVTLLPQ